jgi:ribose transport system ATP-binding protein
VSAADPVVRVEGISKTFPGTRALDRVSLELRRGEIHALLGNNGSGKSTLIKILAGVYRADPGGTIDVAGKRFAAAQFTPELARSAGLHFVHQNPALFPALSVAENLALGHGYETGRGARIQWRKQHARAAKLIERFRIRAVPELPAFLLEPPDRTLVAIARALQDQDDTQEGVLILDEPTASLAAPEVERLFSTLRGYARAGQTIVFVSHRLDEVLGFTDRVSALRDGRHVGTANTADMTETKLVEMMLGRHIEPPRVHKADGQSRAAALSVTGLTGAQIHGLDLELGRGEVLGLAGLLGAGASQILRLVFGADRRTAGEIQLFGEPFAPSEPKEAIARGVAYVPPDRALESSLHGMSVRANLSAVNVQRYFQGLRLRHDRERADTTAAVERFRIHAASDAQSLATLSGGNQQKVIVARWLRDEPRLLLLDEPTQGVAVHARREIHGFLREAAQRGVSILVVSSDFEELAQLCDRVLIITRGRCTGEVSGTLTGHQLTELAHFTPAAPAAPAMPATPERSP